MTYVGRDHRGRIVFHDAVGALAEEPILLNTQPAVPAKAPPIDPDQAWPEIYRAIWDFTEHWIAIARNTQPSSNNDRVMRQFLAAWNPVLTKRQQIGTRLRGTLAQKGAVVLAVGLELQGLVQQAHQLGIPLPPIDLDRDRSWRYLTPDATFKAG